MGWDRQFGKEEIDKALRLVSDDAVETFRGRDDIEGEVIDGSNSYNVRIWMDGDDVKAAECGCGRKHGYCAHVAAVLMLRSMLQDFYFKDRLEGDEADDYDSSGEVSSLLGGLSKDDLDPFILDACDEFPGFADFFCAYFQPGLAKDLEPVIAAYRGKDLTEKDVEELQARIVKLISDGMPKAVEEDHFGDNLLKFFIMLDIELPRLRPRSSLAPVMRAAFAQAERSARDAGAQVDVVQVYLFMADTHTLAAYDDELLGVLSSPDRPEAELTALNGFFGDILEDHDAEGKARILRIRQKIEKAIPVSRARQVLSSCRDLSRKSPQRALLRLEQALSAEEDEGAEEELMRGKAVLLRSLKREKAEASAIFDYLVAYGSYDDFPARLRELSTKNGSWEGYKESLKAVWAKDEWAGFLSSSGDKEALLAVLKEGVSLDDAARYIPQLLPEYEEEAFNLTLSAALGELAAARNRAGYRKAASFMREMASLMPSSHDKFLSAYKDIISKNRSKSALKAEFSAAFSDL